MCAPVHAPLLSCTTTHFQSEASPYGIEREAWWNEVGSPCHSIQLEARMPLLQDIAVLRKSPNWAGGSRRLQQVMHELGSSEACSNSIGGSNSNGQSKRQQKAAKRSAAAAAAAAPPTAATSSPGAGMAANAQRALAPAAQKCNGDGTHGTPRQPMVGAEAPVPHMSHFRVMRELTRVLEHLPATGSLNGDARALMEKLPGVPGDNLPQRLLQIMDDLPQEHVAAWEDLESREQILGIMTCRRTSSAQKELRLQAIMLHHRHKRM